MSAQLTVTIACLQLTWLTFGLLRSWFLSHGDGSESEGHPDAVLSHLGDDQECCLALVRSHIVHILNLLSIL